MMLQVIMDCVTIFLAYFFGFNLNKWRLDKAKKWVAKHTEVITLENGFKMLKADGPFPLLYELKIYTPDGKAGGPGFYAMYEAAEKDHVSLLCYWDTPSIVSIMPFGDAYQKGIDPSRAKSERIIEFSQSTLGVSFKEPVSEEELIHEANLCCDPNEEINPITAKMQPFQPGLIARFKMFVIDCKYKWYKLFKKSKENGDLENEAAKYFEEHCRLFEVRKTHALLVCDQDAFKFLDSKYIKDICAKKNVDFIFCRDLEGRSGDLMVFGKKSYDLRKIKSEAIIVSSSKTIFMRTDFIGNSDVVEMLKQVILPETDESVVVQSV